MNRLLEYVGSSEVATSQLCSRDHTRYGRWSKCCFGWASRAVKASPAERLYIACSTATPTVAPTLWPAWMRRRRSTVGGHQRERHSRARERGHHSGDGRDRIHPTTESWAFSSISCRGGCQRNSPIELLCRHSCSSLPRGCLHESSRIVRRLASASIISHRSPDTERASNEAGSYVYVSFTSSRS